MIAVATQLAVRVRDPVLHNHARTIVSVVIAIVIVQALVSFTKVIAVPIGKATEELAGIVHVLAVVSAEGWYMCLPASVRTSVYAALWEFCGIERNHTLVVPSTVRVLEAPEIVLFVRASVVALHTRVSVAFGRSIVRAVVEFVRTVVVMPVVLVEGSNRTLFVSSVESVMFTYPVDPFATR